MKSIKLISIKEMKATHLVVVFVLFAALLLMTGGNKEEGSIENAPSVVEALPNTEIADGENTKLSKSELFARMEKLKKPAENFADFYETEKVHGELILGIYDVIEDYYGLPADVLYNQLMKESRGKCTMRANRAGAVGCFQFLDHTAREFGLLNDQGDFRGNPYASAEASARYLVWLTTLIFGEDANPSDWEQLRYSLAAFNAGHGNVKRSGRVRIPNFSETIEYVHDIEALAKNEAAWVYPGDTIEKIAKRTGVHTDELLRGNPNITDDRGLRAHTILSLPDPQTGMSSLLVKKGMSLYQLQSGTGVGIDLIKKANGMGTRDTLYFGDIIKIPTRI
ncbi:MAG: hypothetical protein CL840_03905 [Crocinitomicaceae bacterium]|nr:hypothetical protein [Crocinitomicaceae bacterium]|tara:strand:+ start:213034 stop:214044 length:1011 start_codon:yes stop_codon:yes gene_type:complete